MDGQMHPFAQTKPVGLIIRSYRRSTEILSQ
ncbi:MAG: hypothetical protein ACI8TF_001968 [Paracoccaceae bacterium]|jgi:hypothetical protein